jgi:hypothetical protein
MKSRPTLVVAAVIVLVGTGSILAIMNNACKTGQHEWCAPVSMTRHQAKIGRG